MLAPPLSPVHHLEFKLQRVEYEAMIASLLEKTLDCVHQSLNDAKLNPQDIHKIMLVGGATRTPLVHRLLHERLGLEPRFEINPDLIVAMGAAIQAGVMAGEKSHSILVDITPHTYSTSALRRTGFSGEMMCWPIIPRNTPLPAGKSEIFFTVMDEQEKAEVTVFQGESDKPEENNFIGNFLVENLAKVPAGNPLVIHYDLDVNGLLKVTATEKNTGVAKTAVLDTRGAHALDVSEARRNIASLIGNATGGEPVDTGTDGDAGAEALAGSEPSRCGPNSWRRCGRITAAGWWRKNARSSIKVNPQAKRSWRPEAAGNRGVRRGDKPPGGGVPIARHESTGEVVSEQKGARTARETSIYIAILP